MGCQDSDRYNAARRMLTLFPGLDEKVLEAYIAIQSLFLTMHEQSEEFLAQFKLNRARVMPLIILFKAPDHTIKTSELADRVGVSRATITGILDSLEKARLIVRDADPNDRRAIFIKLTKKGRELMQKVIPAHFELVGKMLSQVSPSEGSLLDVLAKRVEANISKLPKHKKAAGE